MLILSAVIFYILCIILYAYFNLSILEGMFLIDQRFSLLIGCIFIVPAFILIKLAEEIVYFINRFR
jgi:hypothetical protein